MFVTFVRSPFYGEDFYCEIPRSFRHLSFYIFDRDVFRRDSSIGEWTPAPPVSSCVIYVSASEQLKQC